MFLLEIFSHDFMVRALLVGVFTGLSTAVLGNFVVTARQAIISDMLAHTALVGVGIGVLFNISPTLLGFVVTVLAGIVLCWLNRRTHQAPEALSMLLLTGGLATALVLTHLNKNATVSLESYLFGSILTITEIEMYSFMALNVLVILVILMFWQPLLTLVFDREFLHTRSQPFAYDVLFMVLVAVVVGIGLKVIGGLLIGALLIIPVLVAQIFSHSFKQNVGVSLMVNVAAILLGLFVSFYVDVPASGSIVLSLVGFYFVARSIRGVQSILIK